MATTISGLPENFANLLAAYHSQISDAIRKNSHHDHRRALLMDFLRKTFGIEVDEVELEKKIKVAEARGRIDAFYKYVIFEVKINLERERSDALSELKKYFESRTHPNDYIAVVTDGIHCEIFDYDSGSKQPREVRPFEINPDAPEETYLELDELLTSGKKIPPTSDDIVGRFGLKTMTFLRSLKELEQAFDSVEHDSSSSRSFSSARLIMSSSFGGTSGLRRIGGTGARSMMAWEIIAEVSPRNGKVPVAIS
jgi:hypothetical protein